MNLPTTPLMLFGFAGQALFSARFVVQWAVSESRKQSVVPLAFWYLSLGGGLLLLIYAILRHDPVFVLGQSAGLAVYARNLVLISRERAAARQASRS
jgi:lipid-A-disaccharide synthase-like uncharacterized protein